MERRVGRAGVGVVVAAVLTLGACGSSSGSGAEANDAAGLEAAVREIGEQAVAGDWLGLYDRLGERCRSELSRADWAEMMYEAQRMMGEMGQDPTGGRVADVRTRDVVDGHGEAQLVIEIDGEPLFDDTWDEYAYEDGSWRATECVGLGADLDGSSTWSEDDWSLGGDDSTGTTYDGQLRPADEVAAEEALAGATELAVGETGSLGDGLSVTVDRLEAGVSDGYSVVAVTLRMENRSGWSRSVPDVYLTCDTSTYPGSLVAVGPGLSVFDDFGEIPSRSFAAGELALSLPGQGPWDDEGAPVTCEAPVRLWLDDYETGRSLVLLVPDDVLAEVRSETGTA